jgi:hypothetical protein
MNLIEQGFLKSKLFIESKGGILLNISRNTRLNELIKKDFNEFLNEFDTTKYI